MVRALEGAGMRVMSLNRQTYEGAIGRRASLVINCNGNSARFLAGQDPAWDFQASVDSVHRSLFDFQCDVYIFVSTIDVYNDISHRAANHESVAIDPGALHPYGFHKWIAERLVERYAPRSLVLRVATVLGPELKKNPIFDLINKVPLRISPDSELNLIGAASVASACLALVQSGDVNEVYNIASIDSVSPAAIAKELGIDFQVDEAAAHNAYRYAINVEKISKSQEMPSSKATAIAFVREMIGASS